ncbi:6-pyruvoyl trahydropterin synthase family protein [Streptomyces sp. T028]|uniref:6-pyruvoyl trahydropterin synthase family protein n=1 Tax=Streptomyces sp. T028 TaxID=3394379 RepID=UPI003A899760
MAVTQEITLYFEATHALPMLPRWHHEHSVHGHQYELGFVFAGQDAAVVGRNEQTLKRWADEQLRGQHLNGIVGQRPSDELFAVWAYEQWADRMPGLTEVRVSQTRDTAATYRAA